MELTIQERWDLCGQLWAEVCWADDQIAAGSLVYGVHNYRDESWRAYRQELKNLEEELKCGVLIAVV